MALEKFVKLNVTTRKKTFQANQVVYCESLKNYVQIKDVMSSEQDGAHYFEVRVLDDLSKKDIKNEVQVVSLD